MKLQGRLSWRRAGLFFVAAAAFALAVSPLGTGFSAGITTATAGIADFDRWGCTSCHGPSNEFAPGASYVTWTIVDADGDEVAGNAYVAGAEYTITIHLDKQVESQSDNRGGFNLRVTAGDLAGVEGESQAEDNEATHVNPRRDNWTVAWTAPADGPAIFDLFVNDVEGDGVNSPGDHVYRVGWFLTDEAGTMPGVAAEEPHVGVPLPQYWLGLLALAGMLFIMLFAFVYLRYFSPHHSDKGDR